MGSCLFFTAKSWPLVDEHAAREGPRRTCRERRGRTAGCTISSRRGAGSRRGRRQGAASRAPRSSSARSAPTRQRARSRRRRRSRSSTANGLAAQGGARSKQHAAECRTANGGGRRHHHRQPDVKQGGAAGYLRPREGSRRAPRQRRTLTCRTATVPAVTYGDYRAEEAKRNSGNPG